VPQVLVIGADPV